MKYILTFIFVTAISAFCVYGEAAKKGDKKYKFKNRYEQTTQKIEQYKKDLKTAQARKRPNTKYIITLEKKIDRYSEKLSRSIDKLTERINKKIERLKQNPECNVKFFNEDIEKNSAEVEFYDTILNKAQTRSAKKKEKKKEEDNKTTNLRSSKVFSNN
ncbi:MAG: hypothetical protein GY750_16810 [Lentisphaerae bacterium]|nr:hypothetical protein [Lentisphaerota bacterium]MCP4103058.1 hypothetical protein [Lentisphaerota bacterium]